MSSPTQTFRDKAGSNDPKWHAARTVNTPSARLYSEWILLVQDLEYALNRARLWSEMAKAESPAGVAVSLFRDAVISFVSCFDKQLSVHLDSTVALADIDGSDEYFAWLQDMRNTWVAHRSGPYRLCVAAIVIDEHTGAVQGVGHLSHSYKGPKPDAARDLIRVIEVTLDHAHGEVRRHEHDLRNELDKLNKFERLSLPLANTTVPSSEDIRMGRKKFQNIKGKSQRKRRV